MTVNAENKQGESGNMGEKITAKVQEADMSTETRGTTEEKEVGGREQIDRKCVRQEQVGKNMKLNDWRRGLRERLWDLS